MDNRRRGADCLRPLLSVTISRSKPVLHDRNEREVGGRHRVIAQLVGAHPGERLAFKRLNFAFPAAADEERHEQVKIYTGRIQNTLMDVPQGTRSWLAGRYITWQDLIFDTAACFTHREASVEYFRKYYNQDMKQGKYMKKWERFSILEPDEIPRWVSTLCFEANIEDIANVQSYRLTQKHIIRIATELFSTTEWTAIDKLMQVSKPYGYLLVRQNGKIVVYFALDQEKMIIGRGESCDITIPHEFKFVSREHVKITRSDRGVSIEDCSRNGTFINGVLLETPIYLNPGQQFTLGGNKLVDGVCLLEFSLDPPTTFHT